MARVDLYTDSMILKYENGDESLERDIYFYSASPDDKVHIILEGDNIFNIAFRYYGDSSFWYMIADTNLLYNPFSELVPGESLIIPYGNNN